MSEAVRGIPWSEDGAVKSIWFLPFVEVGGLHGLLHIPHGEHALGRTCRGFEAGPHCQVFLGVNLLVFVIIHFVEVLYYGLVHFVSITNELVSHNDGSHHSIAALHPEDLFSRGIECLQVPGSEEGAELINYFMVV